MSHASSAFVRDTESDDRRIRNPGFYLPTAVYRVRTGVGKGDLATKIVKYYYAMTPGQRKRFHEDLNAALQTAFPGKWTFKMKHANGKMISVYHETDTMDIEFTNLSAGSDLRISIQTRDSKDAEPTSIDEPSVTRAIQVLYNEFAKYVLPDDLKAQTAMSQLALSPDASPAGQRFARMTSNDPKMFNAFLGKYLGGGKTRRRRARRSTRKRQIV